MKEKIYKLTLGLALCSLTVGVGISLSTVLPRPAEAAVIKPVQIGVPTSLDLNRCSEQEIRDYYQDLNKLSGNELLGFNLAKNLKPILYNGMTYVNYDNVWETSRITERDWARSPASAIPNYQKATNTVTSYDATADDPLLKVMYRNDNGTHNIKASAARKHVSGTGGLNREHVWSQSRGFKKPNSGASGPAGTDVHHLIIADAEVNQHAHSNWPYGEVNTIDKKYENTANNFIVGNYRGTNDKYSDTVFQPIASDRGDIARACFYMMARYNNLSGTDTITAYEPNLIIDNEGYALTGGNGSIWTTKEKPTDPDITTVHPNAANMSYLEYLLKWHHEDPVDDFEIYRNDLIFRNVQHNRNPFIDFPAWADVMFGQSNGKVDPRTNKIHAATLESQPSTKIDVTGVTLTPTTLELKVGNTSNLTAKVAPNDATNQNVTFKSNNENVATVDSNGLVKAIKEGTAKITVTTEEGGFSASCNISVIKDSTPEPPNPPTPPEPPVDPEPPATLTKTTRTVAEVPTTHANIKNNGVYYITGDLINGTKTYLDATTINNNRTAATTVTDYATGLDDKPGAFTFEQVGTDWKLKSGANYLTATSDSMNLSLTSSGSTFTINKSGKKYGTPDSNTVIIDDVAGAKRDLRLTSINAGDLYSFYSSNNKNHTHLYLYEKAYTYDLLLDKLKTMNCTTMKDQVFNDRINYLYNRLSADEKAYLSVDNIVGSDNKTYTAKWAFDYANMEYAKNPSPASLDANIITNNHIVLALTISMMMLVSISFIVFKTKKYRKY